MASPRSLSLALLLAAALCACLVRSQRVPPRPDVPARCRRAPSRPVACGGAALAPDRLLPHPDDCELFYYCVAPGAPPVCRQCPARLHFNPRLHVCDHPARAGCRAGGTSPAPPPPPPTEPSPNGTIATGAPERTTGTEGPDSTVTDERSPTPTSA